jgi:hypothetical protein
MVGPSIVVVGGATVVAGHFSGKEANINYALDQTSKDANPRNVDACDSCPPHHYREQILTLTRTNYLGMTLVDLKIYLNYEWNGCDVTGAYLDVDSSWARFLWVVDVTSRNVDTRETCTSGCDDCCPRGACVKLDWNIKVNPPLQATQNFKGTVQICADGSPPNLVISP